MSKILNFKVLITVATIVLISLFVFFLCQPVYKFGTYSEVYRASTEVDKKAVIDIKSNNTATLYFKERENFGYNTKTAYEYIYFLHDGQMELKRIESNSEMIDERFGLKKFTIKIPGDFAQTRSGNDLKLTNYSAVFLLVLQIISLVILIPIVIKVWFVQKPNSKNS